MFAAPDNPNRSLPPIYLMLRLIGILAAVLLLAFLGNNRNWTALFAPSGQITTGSKYGVAIGDSKAVVLRKLKAEGFDPINIGRDGTCLARRLQGDEFIYAFELNWRHGVVCIGLGSGTVKEIAWDYNQLNP